MNDLEKTSKLTFPWGLQVNQKLDQVLYGLSSYALPTLIGLLSLLAFFVWETPNTSVAPQPLPIRVITESTATLEPAQAMAQLHSASSTPFHDTQRSESPVWFSFDLLKEQENTPLLVEFPSRHANGVTCWDGSTLALLGMGNRTGSTGKMVAIKAGFALELKASLNNAAVVCRSSAIGPARMSALQWRAVDLLNAAQEFHRKSGLLEGGVLILACFILINALINRNGLYLLFAVWLVINLRMAALSAGWDTQWLGNTIPQDWLLRFRLITTALFYILTITLFRTLFHDNLVKVGSLLLLRLTQWSSLPLLVLATVMTYRSYLPFLWVSSALTVGVLVYFLVRIFQKSPSQVAIWYAAALMVTLVSSFYEVVAAALGIQGLIGSINFVTAALSSSLLTALAIAEHMRQEHAQRLQAQAELFHTFEAMPIGLFTLDLQGRFLSANPALLDMLDTRKLAIGVDDWQQHFPDDAWSALYQMVCKNQQTELEINGLAPPNTPQIKRFLVKATLAHDKIEGSLQDITEKSRAFADLHFLANHDSLTSVLNRRGIEIALCNAIDQQTPDSPLAVAYLDLDRFKLINDMFGHGAGNEVLKQMCQRVSSMLSHNFEFGRVGGDEFVIVFPDTPIAMATVLCHGLKDSIGNEPYRLGDNAFSIHCSIGLIEASMGMQFNDAMSIADRACRQAKSAGGGGVVVYEKHAAAFKQHEAEVKLIALLATPHATDYLYLEMQPIMSLTAPDKSLNFEVLLRMRNPKGEQVNTEHLIKAAEASARMGMIDRWVLTSTLAWLNAHHEQMKHTKFVCVNLSGASLNNEDFLTEIYCMLEQNMHLTGQLCLEITESVALHDIDNTRRFVDRVRGYGVKVALDDFGAGYTSFSYLKEFTADLLKIDGNFIVNMNQHPKNISIVEAIVNLAKNLGMKVIAEWAEDVETVQTLTEIGVDYVQGFAVARSQHPDKMVCATSSASFVTDATLSAFIEQIEKTNQSLSIRDLFSEPQATNLH